MQVAGVCATAIANVIQFDLPGDGGWIFDQPDVMLNDRVRSWSG